MFNDLVGTMRALTALQEAMDDAMRSDWFGTRTSSMGANPPINVFRQGENLTVVVEIPGANKEDLNIQVKKNVLRIAGKRLARYDEKVSAHRLERPSQEFDRSITLPFSVDAEKIRASYQDGVLALLLPPVEAERPRSIEIA